MTGRKLTFEEDVVFENQSEDQLMPFEDANVDHLTRFSNQGSTNTNPF
jgi:hypothetical protein